MPDSYVFRRPWKSWRRDRPHPPFNLPPPAPPAVTPDVVALGRRYVIAFAGDKKWTFRRPWWNWGGAQYRGTAIHATGVETVTLDKWFAPLSEPMRKKPQLPRSLQAPFGYVAAATQNAPHFDFAEQSTADKWFSPLSEPTRVLSSARRPMAGQQQFAAFHPWPAIDVSWFSPLAEPVRIKPRLGTPLQLVSAQPHWPDIRVAYIPALSEPVRQKPQLPVPLQMASSFHPLPITHITWFAALAEPVRQKPRLPTPLQQFNARPDWPDIRVAFIPPLSEPVRVKPRLPASIQVAYFPSPAPAPGRPFARVTIIM